MQINKTSFAVGVGSAVLLGAALIPALAAAQTAGEDPTATPTESATATATGQDEGNKGIECGPGFAVATRFHAGEDLAEALGVTTEELHAAYESAHESVGKPDGWMSREEAEAYHDEIETAVADALGITVEAFEAAQTEVQEQHRAEAIARIQEMVEAGTLTQEQADAMIERLEDGVGPFARPALRHYFGHERGFHDEMFEGGPFNGSPFGGSFFFGAPLFDDHSDEGPDTSDVPTA